MKNNNTLSRSEYILYTLLYAILGCIWYNNLFFRCLTSMTRFSSKCIFFAMVAICIAAGTFKTWKFDRNYLSLTINILFPLGIYSLCTYFSSLWMIILIPSVCFCLIYSTIIISRKIVNRQNFRQIMKNRLYRCYLASRVIITVAMTAAFTPIIINTVFGNSIFHAKVEAAIPDENDCGVHESLDILTTLKPTEWINSSETQKLDTLQTVANIEAKKLGLPHELTVTLKSLPQNLAAYYNDNDRTITLNIDYFDESSSSYCLNSVCHEAYHAFQNRMCDLYLLSDESLRDLTVFENTRYYINEFSNYSDGDGDYTSYYSQRCEADARDYAHTAVTEYYDAIWAS